MEVHFDQFNALLLDKCINLKQKKTKKLDPKLF